MRIDVINGTRTTLLCVLSFVCAAQALVQDGASTFARPGEIKVEYDATNDITKVTLNPVVLAARKQEQLQLGAFYSYQGRVAAKPEAVALAFISSSAIAQGKYETARKLTLIADDERFPLGEAARTVQTQEQIFLELLTASVPYDTWVKVMRAGNVMIRLGISDVKLTPKVLQQLRDFTDSSVSTTATTEAAAPTATLTPRPAAETTADDASSLVKFPSAEVEFIAGPQLKAGSPLNPVSWFDTNAFKKGLQHGEAFPARPPAGTTLTGAVNVEKGSNVVIGAGTRFLKDFATPADNSGRHVVVEDAQGVKRDYILAKLIDDTHLTISQPWGQPSVSGRHIFTASGTEADAYTNLNYYDLALCEYINYYRTGDVRFRDDARKIADSWWQSTQIAEGHTSPEESLSPRNSSLNGLMLRALDGRPEMWPWITAYVRSQFDTWIGKRVKYPGLYYGIRDGGYMLLYAATLARVSPEAAVRQEFSRKSVDAAVNYYARLQYPDGSWRWEDGADGAYWKGYATQAFHVGLLLEGLIAVHKLSNNQLVQTSILKATAHLCRELYRPAPWRGMWYQRYGVRADGVDCSNGCGATAATPDQIREVRQLNATCLHAFGYAYQISHDARYKAWGDEILDATYGKRDGSYGLADFRAKEYDEAYRTGGKYLAWRLGAGSQTAR